MFEKLDLFSSSVRIWKGSNVIILPGVAVKQNDNFLIIQIVLSKHAQTPSGVHPSPFLLDIGFARNTVYRVLPSPEVKNQCNFTSILSTRYVGHTGTNLLIPAPSVLTTNTINTTATAK